MWLCTGEVQLPAKVLGQIERDELRISPAVLMEMRFLQEIERVNIGPDEWMEILRRDFGVAVCGMPFQGVVAKSFALDWTRDPFDRLIVAQAIAGKAKLITKDRSIHKNFAGALW